MSNGNLTDRIRTHYGYIIVAAGFAIWFIGWGSQIALGVFFKSISTEFGTSRAETSGAIALSNLICGIVGLMAGWLTDKIGPRVVITFFGAILGISYLFLSGITDFWQFYLLCAMGIGVGTSILNVPVMVTIGRWFPLRRGTMMGIVQGGAGIGGMLLPSMAAWLILGYSWRVGFFVLGVLVLSCLVIGGLLMRRDSVSLSERRGVDSPSAAKVASSSPGRPNASPVSAILASRYFWILSGEFFCFGFCRSMIVVHTAPYATDLGFSLDQAAAILGAVNLVSTAGRVGMGRLADHIGSIRTLLISYALCAVSLVWLVYAHSLWMLYGFGIIFGIGWGALAVLRFKITAEIFGGQALGLITGMIVMVETLGSFSGSFSAGWLYDLFQSYAAPFLIGAGLSLIGLVLTWLLPGKAELPSTVETTQIVSKPNEGRLRAFPAYKRDAHYMDDDAVSMKQPAPVAEEDLCARFESDSRMAISFLNS